MFRLPQNLQLAAALAVILGVLLFNTGCAGPTTPLGAPWGTNSSQVATGPIAYLASLFKNSTAKIEFEPKHQILHGPGHLKVTIQDPAGMREHPKLLIRHNGLDVTASFLRQANITQDGNTLLMELPVVRLPASGDHLIEVLYGQGKDFQTYGRWDSPVCRAFENHTLASTLGFSPEPELLALIERLSAEKGFNPAFTAALIAQESGFNPLTVSWAKAIGLTQVTPVAEEELAELLTDQFAFWPRYPGINHLPAFLVKTMILSGRVNPRNEWRLNPRASIQGGLALAYFLAERWASTPLARKLASSDPNAARGDFNAELTRLLLASYNSGFARVFNAVNRFGPDWLASPELKEARRYVNRVFSFCDHFSEERS